jgi:hypothetical protein
VSTTGPVSWRFEPLGGAAPAVVLVVVVACVAAGGVVTVAAAAGLDDGLDEPHAASSNDADTAVVDTSRFTGRA